MSKKTDSNSYTMIFAIGMVLVVGSLLAYLASSLKPNIDENKRIEKLILLYQQVVFFVLSHLSSVRLTSQGRLLVYRAPVAGMS